MDKKYKVYLTVGNLVKDNPELSKEIDKEIDLFFSKISEKLSEHDAELSTLRLDNSEVKDIVDKRVMVKKDEKVWEFIRNKKQRENIESLAIKLREEALSVLSRKYRLQTSQIDAKNEYEKKFLKELTKFSWKEFNNLLEMMKLFNLVSEDNEGKINFIIEQEIKDNFIYDQIKNRAEEFEKVIKSQKTFIKNEEYKKKLESLRRKLHRTEF